MGRVLAPYGVRGWVKIAPSTEAPDALLAYDAWWLRRSGASAWTSIDPVGGRLHGSALIVGFRGVETREQAMAFSGALVGVGREAMPDAAADELYWDDLVGMKVTNTQGITLGRIASIEAHGAHPILTVRASEDAGAEVKAGEERLIPYVDAVIVGIDRDAGELEVDWAADY